MHRRTFTTLALAILAGTTLQASPAQAQALPALVTIVVPFSPGGGADQLAREFAQAAQAHLPGTTLIVENKPGANGNIAARFVARQKPDGATLLLGTSSTHALGPLVTPSDVDAVKDFSPATLLAETANAYAVSSTSPWKNLSELITAARAERFTYGTFGAGSSAHLYGLVLANSTGAKLDHVPYKGSGQAITDLLGGHIQSVFLTTSALDAMARDGKVRVLAVTGAKRTRLFPNVPTFEEQGVKQLDFNGWFGLLAPKGTPAPLLEKIAGAAKALAGDKAFSDRMAAQGYDWVGSTPATLQTELARSIGIYKQILAKHPAGLGI